MAVLGVATGPIRAGELVLLDAKAGALRPAGGRDVEEETHEYGDRLIAPEGNTGRDRCMARVLLRPDTIAIPDQQILRAGRFGKRYLTAPAALTDDHLRAMVGNARRSDRRSIAVKAPGGTGGPLDDAAGSIDPASMRVEGGALMATLHVRPDVALDVRAGRLVVQCGFSLDGLDHATGKRIGPKLVDARLEPVSIFDDSDCDGRNWLLPQGCRGLTKFIDNRASAPSDRTALPSQHAHKGGTPGHWVLGPPPAPHGVSITIGTRPDRTVPHPAAEHLRRKAARSLETEQPSAAEAAPTIADAALPERVQRLRAERRPVPHESPADIAETLPDATFDERAEAFRAGVREWLEAGDG